MIDEPTILNGVVTLFDFSGVKTFIVFQSFVCHWAKLHQVFVEWQTKRWDKMNVLAAKKNQCKYRGVRWDGVST